jgi:hypothetical protein
MQIKTAMLGLGLRTLFMQTQLDFIGFYQIR